ncbi:MAG: GNAT family N-acetyltransferase [Gemmatimonadales bacterium]|jgi:ribosomal protein S18 acetylase RimI-like enzyme
MIIRQATVADLDMVAPLYDAYRQFYTQPPDLAAARAFIGDRISRGESTVFLALEDDESEALGFTQLYPAFCSVAAKPYYVLYDLYVSSGARRRGVAKRLMERAQEYASETGAFRLELQTARNNRPAQALYESLGWVRDEQYFVYTLKTG